MGMAEEEREPLVASKAPQGAHRAQPTGHFAMAVQESGPTQRAWEGRLVDCCGNCDAEGWSTFAYVKYCSPIAWGHNMKRAFNASFWKHAVVFLVLFTAWWWLYVGFATHAGIVCGPQPVPPLERPLPADKAWMNKLPDPLEEKSVLAGATWQPEKFLPNVQPSSEQEEARDPATDEAAAAAVAKKQAEEAAAKKKAEEAAAAAKKQAEKAAAAAKKQAEEAAAAAKKQAKEAAAAAKKQAEEAAQQTQQASEVAQQQAQQQASAAEQSTKEALKELQDQFNAQLDQAPDNELLNEQIQAAKKVVADGMAQLNAQLTGMGRKLLHKHDHDDDDDDDDKKHEKHKDKKEKKGKHKDKHGNDKGAWHEHHGLHGPSEFGPDSEACRVAQRKMMLPWVLALFLGVLGALYAARKRTAIRERFGIEGSVCKDVAAWLFCGPCALCQETRTLHANNVQSGIWFGRTMLAAPTHPLQAPPQQIAETKPVKGDAESKV